MTIYVWLYSCNIWPPLESNLGYSLEPTYFTLNPVVHNINNNDPDNMEPPSSSSPSPIQQKSIKKRQRYSVEYKKKFHLLERQTQREVENLVKIE